MNPSSRALKLIHHDTCPACGSNELQFVLRPKDHTVSHEEFDIWECKNCRLRFTQDIPDESTIGPYYQSDEYISHSNTNKGLINGLYQQVRAITLKQKRNLIEKQSGRSEGSLLDIGCGTGEFAGTMKNAGWKVLGLEPDETARKQVIENQGVEARPTDDLFNLEPNSYDVISMWHVLEHVHQLKGYLQQIDTLLKKDGTLFIAVPNYQSSDAEHYQAFWAAYDVPRHLYHFSPNSMNHLLENHGFHVKHHQAMPFDSFYVSMLSERYKHGKLRLVPAFMQGFRSFLQASSRVERCSSVLYIAKKK